MRKVDANDRDDRELVGEGMVKGRVLED